MTDSLLGSLPRQMLLMIACSLGLAMVAVLGAALPSLAQSRPVPDLPVSAPPVLRDNGPIARTGSFGVDGNTPRDIVVVFDRSASVEGDLIEISALSDAKGYLDSSSWRLGVIVFGDSASVAVPLKSPADWTPEDIAHIAETKVGYGTNFSEALHIAIDLLGGPNRDLTTDRRIVLVTDAEFDNQAGQEQANAQRVASWSWVTDAMVPADISLIVIDVNGVVDTDSKDWKEYAEVTPGGRYLVRDAYGSYADTLTRALVDEFSDIIIQVNGKQSRTISVPAYQEQLIVYYRQTDGSITVTLEPPTNTISAVPMARELPDSSYLYEVGLPAEGNWTLSMEGNGTLLYSSTIIERRLQVQLEEYTQRLGQGEPLQVWFSLRDSARPAIPITDSRIQFQGRLVQANDVRAVDISQTSSYSNHVEYYEVKLVNTERLRGDFRLEIDAFIPGRPRPLSGMWPVFFGRVPRFVEGPKVSSPDIRVGQKFSVTADLADLDQTVGEPHVHLAVNGAISSQMAAKDMECNRNTCYIGIDALTSPGTYTLVAVLYGGITQESVPYGDTVSLATAIWVRKLTPWEWCIQNRWGLLAIMATIALFLFSLTQIYQRFQLVAELIGSQRALDPEQRRDIYQRVRREARSGRGRGQ